MAMGCEVQGIAGGPKGGEGGIGGLAEEKEGESRSMKRIAVIDGQGGGIGAAIIKTLKKRFGESVEVLALQAPANVTPASSLSSTTSLV